MTTVLVTGAGRGLGAELVRQYAAEGAEVIACVRDAAAAPGLEGVDGEIHPWQRRGAGLASASASTPQRTSAWGLGSRPAPLLTGWVVGPLRIQAMAAAPLRRSGQPSWEDGGWAFLTAKRRWSPAPGLGQRF